MANPYQTALMHRLTPNQGQVNAPPMSPGFVEQPPTGPPPTLGTGSPSPLPAAPTTSLLNGFEPSKLNAEHAKKSPKYAFGLLAQEFADTPDGLLAMSKDPRFAQAGFQYVGKDKIMAPDPEHGGRMGLVDVGLGFSDGGGRGWQWGAEPEMSAEMPGQAMAPSPMTSALPPDIAVGNLPPTDTGRSAFLEALLQQLNEPTRRML